VYALTETTIPSWIRLVRERWTVVLFSVIISVASNIGSPPWVTQLWLTGRGWHVPDERQSTFQPSQLSEYTIALRNQSNETLAGKLLMGYQGWFACPGDGSLVNTWKHWVNGQSFDIDAAKIDMWPDVSMLEPDELCPTGLALPDGRQAALYSAYNLATVQRHFRWMRDYHIDGVMLQRFSSELSRPALFSFRNQVTENVRIGAEGNERVFAIMYDISGTDPARLTSTLMEDWEFLVDEMRITQSPSYLEYNGKPVLGIWGLGFANRPGTPEQAIELLEFFKNHPDPRMRVSLVGGVPHNWRELLRENEAWAEVYRSLDVLMPWTVGRYTNEEEADEYMRNVVISDIDEATASGIAYMPVVFPGFSWRNLSRNAPSRDTPNLVPPLNQVPRNGGRFFWRQVYNVIDAGATMIYVAMFDELNEGTAMFMLAASQADMPIDGQFVSLDRDGYNLPSDWYLQLAQAAGMMLRREIPLSPLMPITPVSQK
jgi:hypothetical protein